jgi:hypothetical protein
MRLSIKSEEEILYSVHKMNVYTKCRSKLVRLLLPRVTHASTQLVRRPDISSPFSQNLTIKPNPQPAESILCPIKIFTVILYFHFSKKIYPLGDISGCQSGKYENDCVALRRVIWRSVCTRIHSATFLSHSCMLSVSPNLPP